MSETPRETDIAIVGMAGRFPGADSVAAFWRNLEASVESIRRFTPEELLAAGVAAATLEHAAFVPAGAVLSDIETFDAEFFGMRPREAELCDPQRRVLLEVAWHALEDAGIVPGAGSRRIGIYAGIGSNDYFLRHVLPLLRTSEAELHQALLAGGTEFLATRIAYHLDLRGPALTLQTACSSSLAAVHLACQAILAGECDIALAGGVSLRVPQIAGYLHQPGMVQSPDGHCRAFDSAAAGTVGGSGAAIVVLQRHEQALADGACIRALVRGTAINNDGARKGGYAAPSVEGQVDVIREALAAAGLEPAAIDYVEAHGTATALGDLVEAEALRRAFGMQRSRPLWLGSVKTNVGHLDTAAGVTGLIKTALALESGRLPASLHCDAPSVSAPLQVVRNAMAWPAGDEARRAGVSSFGIGGTNAHVVLEAPPVARAAAPPARDWHLLALSARTPSALRIQALQLAACLEAQPELALADVAHTLFVGRRHFESRRAVVVDSAVSAVAELRAESGHPTLPIVDEPRWALLQGLAERWSQGVAIEVADVFRQGPRQRVSLPGYPFECRRFWIQPELPTSTERPTRRADPADWFYTPTWVRRERPQRHALPAAHAVVLADTAGVGARFAAELIARGWRVDTLAAGTARAPIPEGVALIVHFGNVSEASEHGTGHLGFDDLFELVREVGPRPQPPALWVITNGVYCVTGDEPVIAQHALALGIAKVAPAEYRGLKMGIVDIELEGAAAEAQALTVALADEVTAGEPEALALRRAGRFVQLLAPVRLEATDRPGRLRQRGVYLVTGGQGGVGGVLAAHLARAYHARLILVGRTARAHDERVAALISAGAEVAVEAADVADPAAMAAVVERARARFGHIDGVVHAAGVADLGGVMHRRDAASTAAVLAARVEGTRVIDALLASDPPDFIMLCSSLGTAIPQAKFGQVGYAAGAEFLDAYCQARPHVVTLDWADWAEVGMSVAARGRASTSGARALAERALPLVGNLSNQDGVLVFERALASGLSRVLVSPEEVGQVARAFARLAEDLASGPPERSAALRPSSLSTHSLAQLWSDALGVAAVGPDDDFFELGGDSLLAVSLAETISRTLGVRLDPHELLDHPTVAQVSAHLDRAQPAALAAPPMVVLQTGDGAAPPLFLVHPIGGHVLAYRDLVRALGPAQGVFGFQARGLAAATAPDGSIESMAQAYVQALQSLPSRGGPIVLAGASFGGVVAFEMACRLAAAGAAVELAMIDAPSPGWAPDSDATDDAEIVARAVRAVFGVEVDAEALRAIDSAARARFVAERAAASGEPLELGAAQLERMLGVWRANHRALRLYRPAAPYPGAVRCFRPTLLEPGNRLDHDRGWRPWTLGALEIIDVPGDHTTMNRLPNVRVIAAALAPRRL